MIKSKFWTFVFGLLPGAGQMYLGQMRKGAVLMTLFFFVFVLSGMIYGGFALFLPVIWFYAFFDVVNHRTDSPEQRAAQEEEFMQNLGLVWNRDWLAQQAGKRNLLFGVGCLLMGGYMLLRVFVGPYMGWLWENIPALYRLIHNLPTLIVAILVIGAGVWLLRGGKHTVAEDDFVAYHSGDKESD